MESLKSLIEKAQMQDLGAIESILIKFTPKIEKSLIQTAIQERKDLKQEVSLKMIEAIYKYDTNSIPGFWAFYFLSCKNQTKRDH